jgi:hypothetical protein
MADFICVLPFSGSITFDVEKILDVASRKWNQTFHIIKADNTYIVSSGSQQLLLALQKEPLTKEFVDILISSYTQWSYEEISGLRNHQTMISIRAPGNPLKLKRQSILMASVVLALLEQEGVVGFVNAIAQNYYPVSYFQRYMGETVPQLEELNFLFVGNQNQKR